MTNDNHDNVTTDEFFLKIFDDLFVDRTPDVVPLQCQTREQRAQNKIYFDYAESRLSKTNVNIER